MQVKELLAVLSNLNPEANIALPDMDFGDRPEWFEVEVHNNELDEDAEEDECPGSWARITKIQ